MFFKSSLDGISYGSFNLSRKWFFIFWDWFWIFFILRYTNKAQPSQSIMKKNSVKSQNLNICSHDPKNEKLFYYNNCNDFFILQKFPTFDFHPQPPLFKFPFYALHFQCPKQQEMKNTFIYYSSSKTNIHSLCTCLTRIKIGHITLLFSPLYDEWRLWLNMYHYKKFPLLLFILHTHIIFLLCSWWWLCFVCVCAFVPCYNAFLFLFVCASVWLSSTNAMSMAN